MEALQVETQSEEKIAASDMSLTSTEGHVSVWPQRQRPGLD